MVDSLGSLPESSFSARMGISLKEKQKHFLYLVL